MLFWWATKGKIVFDKSFNTDVIFLMKPSSRLNFFKLLKVRRGATTVDATITAAAIIMEAWMNVIQASRTLRSWFLRYLNLLTNYSVLNQTAIHEVFKELLRTFADLRMKIILIVLFLHLLLNSFLFPLQPYFIADKKRLKLRFW